MKKIYLLLVFICMFLVNGKSISAATGSVFKQIKDGVSYQQYDITNDGKKDTLRFENKKESSDFDMYKTFRAYVNGKCALTTSYKYLYYSSEINIVTLANNVSYLFVHLAGDNDDGPTVLYVYKNGKFVKCIDFENICNKAKIGYHNGAVIDKVQGNKIYINMSSMSNALASMRFQAIYKYKSGKLVLQSKVHKVLGYHDGKHWDKMKPYMLTTTKSIQLYRNKELTKKSVKIKKGTKLKVKKLYISGKSASFYVETQNGKKGWFKSPKNTLRKVMFEGIIYAG